MRYFSAWFFACATRPHLARAFVIWFAILHAVLWTITLTSLKAAQDIHMDVAEAFAWGQKFLLGYGKHPPLSGWIAGLWFMLFPVRDWSTYALAMTTIGVSLIICWHIASRFVDSRRAFFTVLMLAIYPIFNFKGFKYNADLLQLVTLPLIVLAYVHAFERRDVRSGVWLGLAATAGVMTKYWALTIIGAAGLAALVHLDRRHFFASPAPWVALGTLAVGMIPHLWWLKQVEFAPFIYAGNVYELSSRWQSVELAATYVGHNIGLLLLPLGAALIALRYKKIGPRSDSIGTKKPLMLNIWIIQTIVAIGPPVAATILSVYIKTDWGIPLFFLVPLSLIAMPWLRIQGIALVRLACIWLVLTLVTLIASPLIAQYGFKATPSLGSIKNPTSQFAQQLTDAWHQRFHSRWSVVAGTTEVGEPMTFYSSDHPAPFTPEEIWSSGLVSWADAKRLGFIGICDTTDHRLATCNDWMEKNAPHAEKIDMTARRFFHNTAGPIIHWKIYIVPPTLM